MGSDLHWLQKDIVENNFHPAMALLVRCQAYLNRVGTETSPEAGERLDLIALIDELRERTTIR